MNRYQITVQHDVIMYGDTDKEVRQKLLKHDFLKDRTNVRCISITQVADPANERRDPLIDRRKAPGQ